ncbi:DUF3841 domain-containing protein [Bacillus sp. Bva_UNVM-123]|uniref:DUF3841 domain-containing protein n=1 Tax=Bacillus sp. Bva_UNVM-123 TaxID=2829798 RepID=UPI00391F03E4
MRVYTVQRIEAYREMREKGYLIGKEKYAWDYFEKPYKWMVSKMKTRIPNFKGENYPIWVWKRRPNRNEKALFKRGTRGVILTLEIPDDQILFSDFDSWHSVLNNSPVCDNEEDWEKYLKDEYNYPVEETWEKIFDFEYLRNGDKDWRGEFNEEWIQGVTPRISMEQVKKVNRFIAK